MGGRQHGPRSVARARADAVADALDVLEGRGDIAGFDALSAALPADATIAARLRARDALDLPTHGKELERALIETGFDVEACAPALAAFAHPTVVVPDTEAEIGDGAAFLRARHIAVDQGDTLAVNYVRPKGDAAADARALAAIRAADPGVVVTGYPALEAALKDTLSHDLPRIAFVAFVVVAIALRAALKRLRDGLLVLASVIVEIAALGMTMRLAGIHWHVYNALVLPVLLGITLDEAMFLLHAVREGEGEKSSPGEGTVSVSEKIDAALEKQAPLVTSTALTTAAGFGALLTCSFGGLRDMGAVGLLGVLFGLVAALIIVPAGLRAFD